MLAIRLQRRGRKDEAQYRIIVQDARRHPTSGRLVTQLGTFNPHTKATVLNKEQAALYLNNGAQPSPRVARLLKAEGVKLPGWVSIEKQPKRDIRHPDKLRKNRPAEAAPAAEPAVEDVAPVDAPSDVAKPEETPAAAPETAEAEQKPVETEDEKPAA